MDRITAHVHDVVAGVDIRARVLRKNPTSSSAGTTGTEVTVTGNSGFMSAFADTTPVHVIDKSSKLETLFDRIAVVDARFEVARRELELEALHRARSVVVMGIG